MSIPAPDTSAPRFPASRPTPPIAGLLRRLERHRSASADDAAAFAAILAPPRRAPRGAEIVVQGDELHESTLVVSGLAARSVLLRDGSEQITALHLAGDFADLHGLHLPRADHRIVAITDCVVTRAAHGDLRRLADERRFWSDAFAFIVTADAAAHRRWIVMTGRLSALAGLGHLLCEMWVRCRDAGLAQGLSYDLPLLQQELANVLGLSTVHVNRILQNLRRERLVRWTRGRVTIEDWDRLADIAQFDPAYLQHRSVAPAARPDGSSPGQAPK